MPAPAVTSDTLHTRDLDFSLDSLAALSSTQLALVQFHHQADPAHVDAARVEFMRRRDAWLLLELDRVSREASQQSASLTTETPPAASPRRTGPVARQGPTLAAAVKREVEEISLLESDDDEVVCATPATTRKRNAKSTVASSSAAIAAKRPKTMSGEMKHAAEASRRTLPAHVQRVSSAPPRPAAPSPTVAPKAPRRSAAHADDLDMPFALPRSATPKSVTPASPSPPVVASERSSASRSSSSSTGPVPTTTSRDTASAIRGLKSAKRARPLAAANPQTAAGPSSSTGPTSSAGSASTTASTDNVSLDFLYRRTSSTTTADETARTTTVPIFTANPIAGPPPVVPARRVTFVAEAPPAESEPDRDFWFRPPRPFPTFSPIPRGFGHGAEEIIPTSLVKQLHTVRVAGLHYSITKRLLLAFLYRNQHRLRPRPLAVASSTTDVDEDRRGRSRTWYLAFRNEADAQLTIQGSNGRQLPRFGIPDERTLLMTYVREAINDVAGVAAETAVGYTWGSLSDEVRDEYKANGTLPKYRVCPRLEFEPDEDDGRLISDEYEAEADHIHGDNYGTESEHEDACATSDTIKSMLYAKRCKAWLAWLDRPDREQALQDGAIEYPPWPTDDAKKEFMLTSVSPDF
ncbi:hypothetical protein BMF94_3138 [Rhodotorula taiwanensis]|uniref:Uncharacterized protein n=1 Tax=Rhodotorula taiwanensis TaxID=741276 RepID=A0A2S5BA02_9BASI|nr:hypothetical protein BMF94_3138 [Rhodotorula taiwanensis]